MSIWIHKYMPSSASEVVGQNKAVETITDYITNYSKQKKKGMILYGSPGNGKTSTVHAIANEKNLEVIEVNSSDFRTKDQINQRLGPAVNQMSLFGGGKIILVDEVDGISGNKDRGGVAAIVALLKESKFPVILTANDPFNSKFSSLRKVCEMVEFHTLNYLSIAKILKLVCEKENLDCGEDILKTLARRVGGDARAAVNDLQMLAGSKKTITKEDFEAMSPRDQLEKIHNALMKVFKSTDYNVTLDAYDSISEDMDAVFLWLDENLPKEYTTPADLARAYDKISRADVFKGRIRRRQHWRFLAYIYPLLSAGIATSKDEKYKAFNKYTPTTRILALWRAKMKYQKRKDIAGKLASYTHSSTKQTIRDNMAYFQALFKSNKEFQKEITEELELSKDEVAWLLK